ncbi:hypothetical protein COU95_02990 [Candidatus Shapirobacteria bacterium CG10_big_fil_rev_8_21_14_0_10_40_9]|uniref:Uncharacterized protein n=1 Tax=Candidatus Shapirobacteria bacterium CG10_big_fil_rev_8_21_14_0_10_40_9 TaxID=1974888 RepID=A0A2M8L346_9BACT|nr:MAG: hypothetical protein COU95_02990 [Candidatus Shapirobacteria bacterium CG10_big_fil_rev_8_21_14_0_10_40_9]
MISQSPQETLVALVGIVFILFLFAAVLYIGYSALRQYAIKTLRKEGKTDEEIAEILRKGMIDFFIYQQSRFL